MTAEPHAAPHRRHDSALRQISNLERYDLPGITLQAEKDGSYVGTAGAPSYHIASIHMGRNGSLYVRRPWGPPTVMGKQDAGLRQFRGEAPSVVFSSVKIWGKAIWVIYTLLHGHLEYSWTGLVLSGREGTPSTIRRGPELPRIKAL